MPPSPREPAAALRRLGRLRTLGREGTVRTVLQTGPGAGFASGLADLPLARRSAQRRGSISVPATGRLFRPAIGISRSSVTSSSLVSAPAGRDKLVPISPASADVADRTGSVSDSARSKGGSTLDSNMTSTCQSPNSLASGRGRDVTCPTAYRPALGPVECDHLNWPRSGLVRREFRPRPVVISPGGVGRRVVADIGPALDLIVTSLLSAWRSGWRGREWSCSSRSGGTGGLGDHRSGSWPASRRR